MGMGHLARAFGRPSTPTVSTFHQYLTRVRLDHARDLLLHNKLPVKAIAAACGYETQSHFGAVFRRHCGLSPAAYRAGHKE